MKQPSYDIDKIIYGWKYFSEELINTHLLLMVAQSAIKNLNNICDSSKLSDQPLDLKMSKYKPSSSPMRHPLYQLYFGNNSADIKIERNDYDEQGEFFLKKNKSGNIFFFFTIFPVISSSIVSHLITLQVCTYI